MRHRLATLKNRFVSKAKDLGKLKNIPEHFTHEKVPYFCQWESRNLAESILEKRLTPQDDPAWGASGAQTTEEYTSWSWSGCGMACLKMVLAHSQNKTVPLVTLGKQCLNYGGYKLPLEDHPGLYYQPFIEFIHKDYGLKGKVVSGLSVKEIIEAIAHRGFAIVSVTPEIRNPDKKPKKQSGHLVLVVGYDLKKKILYIHNPSGTEKSNQEYAEISIRSFAKYFSHKGITIDAPKSTS